MYLQHHSVLTSGVILEYPATLILFFCDINMFFQAFKQQWSTLWVGSIPPLYRVRPSFLQEGAQAHFPESAAGTKPTFWGILESSTHFDQPARPIVVGDQMIPNSAS